MAVKAEVEVQVEAGAAVLMALLRLYDDSDWRMGQRPTRDVSIFATLFWRGVRRQAAIGINGTSCAA